MALSYSSLASLQEHTTAKLEVEPTTCVCLRTQSTAPPSHIEMEHKNIILMFMVQSIKVLYMALKFTMHFVLCVMCLLDQL